MIRWDYLDRIADEKRREWSKEGHIRYIVIDDMLEPGICAELADFSAIGEKFLKPLKKLHKHVRGKSGSGDRAKMTALQTQFFEDVNSPRFLTLMERMTGIKPLYADEKLGGGGLHQIRTGGYLNIHTDFNFDPETRRNRRLNLLLYLNEGWQADWGGNIELWDQELDRPFFSALPIANRVLLFETTETSYHGHPAPLASPPGVLRKSLAVYYYSDWPEGVDYRADTGYQLSRMQWAQLMSRIAKLMAKRKRSEDEAVEALRLDYMTGDIRTAYRTLMGLRSAKTIREEFWESADGTRTLEKPE